MNAKQKIFSVMKQIKEESEINPDSRWVKFNFNVYIVGAGILNDDEEKRVLLKLQKEKIIKLHLPDEDQGSLEVYKQEEFMMKNKFIFIEILDNFYKKYQIYVLFYSRLDFWKITNAFWWLWELILFVYGLLKIAAKTIKNNAIISSIVLIITVLAFDYAMAWKNLKYIINLISR